MAGRELDRLFGRSIAVRRSNIWYPARRIQVEQDPKIFDLIMGSCARVRPTNGSGLRITSGPCKYSGRAPEQEQPPRRAVSIREMRNEPVVWLALALAPRGLQRGCLLLITPVLVGHRPLPAGARPPGELVRVAIQRQRHGRMIGDHGAATSHAHGARGLAAQRRPPRAASSCGSPQAGAAAGWRPPGRFWSGNSRASSSVGTWRCGLLITTVTAEV
jgi:hypothetical protein